jgi:hypothetical protein
MAGEIHQAFFVKRLDDTPDQLLGCVANSQSLATRIRFDI